MTTTATATGSATRTEKDTMGAMTVPADALWGASTQRAVENFPISGRPMPPGILHAYGHLKAACAKVNLELGRLNATRAEAIIKAATEIGVGQHHRHFPIDVFQTGSGTSTNMNANEVIANLICIARGVPIGSSKDAAYIGDPKTGTGVHPNDHVNLGQSSNDTFPTAIRIAAAYDIHRHLLPCIESMLLELEAKAEAWDDIVKIGRTHLQDATPIRLGQEFEGYAQQMRHAQKRAQHALDALLELPIGGTAVGTGINTHPKFAAKVCEVLTKRIGVEFVEAVNHPEAQAAKDSFVGAHGELRTIAVALSKIANDYHTSVQSIAAHNGIDNPNLIVAGRTLVIPPVSGDAQWLKQALINLLDNSLRYTPPGGKVIVRLRHVEGRVEIAVRDTGHGIEPEHLPHLFEHFYRTDKARSREEGGSGLGLSIVAWLAQAHNGRVTVESTPQVGSTFFVWLPEYVAAVQPVHPDDEMQAS